MANTTASTLINRCLDHLAKAGSVTTRSGTTLETMALDWLNAAQQAIARKHNFRDALYLYSSSTVADQKSYTLPVNTKQIKDIRIIDGTSSVKMIREMPRHFDMRVPYPEDETTNKPMWYIRHGDNLDFFPIPDDAYTIYIRCYLWPTKITATTTAVFYQPDRDDIVEAYMVCKGFEHYQMYEDSNYWKAGFKEQLKEAILSDDFAPDYDPMGRGFSASAGMSVGDPWNDPLVNRYP